MPAHRSFGHRELHRKNENHTLLARLCTGIQEMVETYSRCYANRNFSAHEPLIPTPVPEYPFQKVGADLFTLDDLTYLLTVDYYSKWLSVSPLHDTKSIDVIRELKRIFADFGRRNILVTDGGPRSGSHEFRRFASDWLVQHYHVESCISEFERSSGTNGTNGEELV